jgi:hypothetical protein
MARSNLELYIEDAAFKVVLKVLKAAVWWMKKLDSFKTGK